MVQNWFHVNSEWQKNPEISTLCFSTDLSLILYTLWKLWKLLLSPFQNWNSVKLFLSERAQCGNVSIFLPLRLYVKSNLFILKPRKLLYWPYLVVGLNFEFLGNFSHFQVWKGKKHKKRGEKSTFKTSKVVKVAVFFTFWIWPQNWFHVKSNWKENC